MKSRKIVGITIGIAILIAATSAGFAAAKNRERKNAEAARLQAELQAEAELTEQRLAAAAEAHKVAYDTYVDMSAKASGIALKVTEQGRPVGEYTLAQLGLPDLAQPLLDAAFHEDVRRQPSDFEQLPQATRLDWQAPEPPTEIALPTDAADLQPVLDDLNRIARTPAADAYVTFDDGAYHLHSEAAGNVLRPDVVRDAIAQSLSQLTLTQEGLRPAVVEITDTDCYEEPAITLENADFDLQKMLDASLTDVKIELSFQGDVQTLNTRQLRILTQVDENGALRIDDDALQALVADYAAQYTRSGVPFLLDGHADGWVEIPFLTVDYALDEPALADLLRDALLSLQDCRCDAPFLCTRYGEPFSLGTEYVEVNLQSQTMAYYQDGAPLVTTDVVSGDAYRSPTPVGLYRVENKDTCCWLSGPDYNVYVDYWIGFIGFYYGLHDADWRTEFGGTHYQGNGSHGCVNTPKENLAVIFDNINIGVPVLIHDPGRR